MVDLLARQKTNLLVGPPKPAGLEQARDPLGTLEQGGTASQIAAALARAPSVAGARGVRPGLGMGEQDETAQALAAGTVGAGRMVQRAGERLGILDELSSEAFQTLQAQQPIATGTGEIGAEIGLTAPLGAASAATQGMGLLARFGLNALLGAGEGALFAEDAKTGAAVGGGLGGLLGAASNRIDKAIGLVSQLFFKRSTGLDAPIEELVEPIAKKTFTRGKPTFKTTFQPTKKLKDALEAEKLSFDDVAENIEQRVRQELFEELDIPTTKSRITQAADDFLTERQLSRQTEGAEKEVTEQLRDRLRLESASFKARGDELSDRLGFAEDVGDSIKEALEASRTGKNAIVKQRYQELAQLDADGLPLVTGEVIKSTTDPATATLVKRLRRQGNSGIRDLDDLFVEFGVDADPEKVAAFADDLTPLNVLNSEEFRQALNDLLDPANPGLNRIVGAAKDGLDRTLDELDKSLKGTLGKAGAATRDVIAATKRARATAKEFLGEFNPKFITQQLVAKKKGSFDAPLIEASEVYRKLLRTETTSGTPENVTRLVNSLDDAGEAGQKALGNLRATVVMDLVNEATKNQSAKLGEGVIKWSGVKFTDRLIKIGDEKLGILFRGDPEAAEMIKKLQQAGESTTELITVAKNSGTADDLINFFKKVPAIGRLLNGFAGPLAQAALEETGKRQALKKTRSAVKRQLETSPMLRQNYQSLLMRYPNVLVILGIEGLSPEKPAEF